MQLLKDNLTSCRPGTRLLNIETGTRATVRKTARFEWLIALVDGNAMMYAEIEPLTIDKLIKCKSIDNIYIIGQNATYTKNLPVKRG